MTQNRKRLGLAVPEVLYEKLTDQAKYQGKTINSTCLDIFWDYFESRDRKNMCGLLGYTGGNKEEEEEKEMV